MHISLVSVEAKTIKLADLIHNSISTSAGDPNFWEVQRAKKLRLLEVLNIGDPQLLGQARALVEKP